MDNGSIHEVLPQIESECARVGAELVKRERQDFTNFYSLALSGGKDFAIVDPDVVFWACVEDLKFDALIAGRKIPDLVRYGVRSLARLHPSMIFVPDAEKLQEEISRRSIRGLNTIGQYSAHIAGKKLFWDTLAPIYQMMPDLCHEFDENELDRYDHLFYGSHLPVIEPGLADDGLTLSHHVSAAKGDLDSLRGIWRAQEKWFLSQSPKLAEPNTMYGGMMDAAQTLANASGVDYDGVVDQLIEALA